MTYELPVIQRFEKSPLTYNGRNGVTTLVLLILNESCSFLQIATPTIKARMRLNLQDSITDSRASCP